MKDDIRIITDSLGQDYVGAYICMGGVHTLGNAFMITAVALAGTFYNDFPWNHMIPEITFNLIVSVQVANAMQVAWYKETTS